MSQTILSKQIQRYCTRREVSRGREIYQKPVGYTMNLSDGKFLPRNIMSPKKQENS